MRAFPPREKGHAWRKRDNGCLGSTKRSFFLRGDLNIKGDFTSEVADILQALAICHLLCVISYVLRGSNIVGVKFQ